MISDKFLTAEYVIDGRAIKLGTDRLAGAAEEAHKDFVSPVFKRSFVSLSSNAGEI